MKIIVTHTAPDWDAIGGVWILRKFLPGWDDAGVEFVPAGQRREDSLGHNANDENDPIEIMGEDEVIHVDTGLGPLDHHQTPDKNVSGTSRAWDFVKAHNKELKTGSEKVNDKIAAIDRIVTFIVETDHFKEVFWDSPDADYHEFTILGILEGLKLYKPNEDDYYVEFGIECLESLLRTFDNRIWAEREIEKALRFETTYGDGLAFETINDTVLKLAQKKGYILVVRKDPRKGYVRIKTRPSHENDDVDVDLTSAYEKLKELDPDATWFLHVSKKMLLNGTPKNPKMVPTKLSLDQIVEVLKSI